MPCMHHVMPKRQDNVCYSCENEMEQQRGSEAFLKRVCFAILAFIIYVVVMIILLTQASKFDIGL